MDAAQVVGDHASRQGPLRFDEVLEIALYHPEVGFYSAGGGAGRQRDFLTSPELGRLFGAVIGRALDSWWRELGEPDPFVVVEAGAGAGTLAASVLACGPACATALRYVLVERSEALRGGHAGRLPVAPGGLVLGPHAPAAGPLVTSLPELPAGRWNGVVLANELLDNLPFRLLKRTTPSFVCTCGRDSDEIGPDHDPMCTRNPAWSEVFVDHELREVLVPVAPEVAAEADRLAPDAEPGTRIPLQHQANAWVRAARGILSQGRVVVIDYADTTPRLAARPWTDWVRTYRSHGRGTAPLDDLGAQDVTCEVATDQLPPTTSDTAQADFLRAYGIDDLTAAARKEWEARAHIGDLTALEAKARVTQAAALTDPSGLGAFRVLEWDV